VGGSPGNVQTSLMLTAINAFLTVQLPIVIGATQRKHANNAYRAIF
jgi:hypothetical protein